MEPKQGLTLENLLSARHYRRSLLPLWMKIFIWIFLLTGLMSIFLLLLSFTGLQLQLALYGLESTDPASVAGRMLTLLFFIKGVAAFGLWFERSWAIKAGMADAILGMAVCFWAMSGTMNLPGGVTDTADFRLELLLLGLYFYKLLQLRTKWNLGRSHDR